ncbi:MAG TPA: FAD-dependent oxidoreductase [Acetobacteraceae bacterium]|jgi:cation diffusion facilitator CzcD-associated flavoprotein CzcO
MLQAAVIGAGPYGLSVAAHLRNQQVRCRVFGIPMLMWRRHMPEGMLVKSSGFATNLSAPGDGYSLERHCAEYAHPYAASGLRIPRETMVEYGLEFQRRHAGPVEEVQVVAVTRQPGGFRLDLETGEQVEAAKLVVASGLARFANIPGNLAALSGELLTHSSAHHDLMAFANRSVVVVGGGQSALESAALLHEAGARVTIVARRPIAWFDAENPRRWDRILRPEAALGPGWRARFWSDAPGVVHGMPQWLRLRTAYSTFGPGGSDWLRQRVDRVIPTVTGAIAAARTHGNEVRLAVAPDGELVADHVIAATGYLPDIRRIPFLAPILPSITCCGDSDRGMRVPVLNKYFESSVPGLHFVGYLSAASFGPAMRFVYGCDFAARRIVPSLIPDEAARPGGRWYSMSLNSQARQHPSY